MQNIDSLIGKIEDKDSFIQFLKSNMCWFFVRKLDTNIIIIFEDSKYQILFAKKNNCVFSLIERENQKRLQHYSGFDVPFERFYEEYQISVNLIISYFNQHYLKYLDEINNQYKKIEEISAFLNTIDFSLLGKKMNQEFIPIYDNSNVYLYWDNRIRNVCIFFYSKHLGNTYHSQLKNHLFEGIEAYQSWEYSLSMLLYEFKINPFDLESKIKDNEFLQKSNLEKFRAGNALDDQIFILLRWFGDIASEYMDSIFVNFMEFAHDIDCDISWESAVHINPDNLSPQQYQELINSYQEIAQSSVEGYSFPTIALIEKESLGVFGGAEYFPQFGFSRILKMNLLDYVIGVSISKTIRHQDHELFTLDLLFKPQEKMAEIIINNKRVYERNYQHIIVPKIEGWKWSISVYEDKDQREPLFVNSINF